MNYVYVFLMMITFLSVILIVYNSSIIESFNELSRDNDNYKLREEYTILIKSYEGKLFNKDKTETDIFNVLKRNINGLIDKGNVIRDKNRYTIPAFFYSEKDILTLRIIFKVIDLEDAIMIETVEILKINETEKTLPEFELDTLTNIEDAVIPILPSEDQFKKEQDRQTRLIEIENTSQCFGIPDSFSISKETECSLFGGVWDKPVKTSDECPFYYKSITKPMSGGKLRDGGCGMPLGVKRNGYRFFSGEPMCFTSSKTREFLKCSEINSKDYYFLD